MDLVVRRFDVFLVALDPTFGREIKKTRPGLVVSPDEMNKHLSTVIIAPMTSKVRSYPFRVPCTFQGKEGQVVLDQIRSLDRARLLKKLGKVSGVVQTQVIRRLQEMFEG